MKKKENGKDGNLKGFKEFLQEEDGMGTVEVILIIVVLVGLVIVFKNQITGIIQSLFSKITSQTNKL
ncbi:MAG: Flp1 family type IVb pilin [Lachnospiraceae bacterium]|nr:Flp1 family type IVb pilin [Lachnospiraceae bacterium]